MNPCIATDAEPRRKILAIVQRLCCLFANHKVRFVGVCEAITVTASVLRFTTAAVSVLESGQSVWLPSKCNVGMVLASTAITRAL